MKMGDLVGHSRSIGILLRKLQYETNDPREHHWDGEPAWWVQFVGDAQPYWSHEEDLHLIKEGN